VFKFLRFYMRADMTARGQGFRIEKLEFLSEPEIYIPTWVFVPEHSVQGARPILYVGETDTETVGYPETGWGGQWAQEGHLVIALDVRGMGQTRPPHRAYDESGVWANLFDIETTMTYASWSLDESLLGMRVQDVIRSVDYALSHPAVDHSRLVVIGSGMGLWRLYATALDPRVQSLIAAGGLLSYKSLVRSEMYKHGADVFIRNGLKHFDLPQIAAAIAGRHLALVSPVGPMKEPLSAAEVQATYQFTQDTYTNAGARDRFQIVESDAKLSPTQLYRALLS
jgi:cephalosporin-C deacetylase-like acetyl esterase